MINIEQVLRARAVEIRRRMTPLHRGPLAQSAHDMTPEERQPRPSKFFAELHRTPRRWWQIWK